MATLAELAALPSNDDPRWEALIKKIEAAAGKKAVALVKPPATPSQLQLDWAKSWLADPRGQADQLIGYVVAENATATIDQILDANDANIEANVGEAVDDLLTRVPV